MLAVALAVSVAWHAGGGLVGMSCLQMQSASAVNECPRI